MRRLLLARVLLLACLAQPATAAQEYRVDAHLTVSGSTQFSGLTNLSIESGGLYHRGPVGNGFRLLLEAHEARLRIINAPFLEAGAQQSPLGNSVVPWMLDTEVWMDRPFTGRIELLPYAGNGSYHVLPLDPTGTFQIGLQGTKSLVVDPPTNANPAAGQHDMIKYYTTHLNRTYWPAETDARLSVANQTGLALEDSLWVFLYGGTLSVQDGHGQPWQVVTGRSVNESRTATDPSKNAGFWYYDQVLLLVEAATTALRIENADPAQIHTSLRSLAGSLHGDLTFAGVSGSVGVDGRPLTPEPVLFQTIGHFQGAASYETGKGDWQVQGPATFVGINGITVVGDRLAHLQQSVWAVVGGVTALGLLLAALTPAGRAFLGGILGRNEAEPLGHPTRKLLLKSIAQTPGITRSQLAQETQITRLLARYHLRILRRAGLIDTVRTGRQVAFALNDASYRFPLDRVGGQPKEPQANGAPKPAVLAVHALAALNGPVRRLIHQALEHAGPCSYDDMAQAWQDLQAPQPWPSRTQVSRHATALLRAGLLERRRTGRRIQWALAVDLALVRSTAMKRVLSNAKTRLVHELATQQPKLSREEMVERFAQRFPTRAASHVDEILLKLEYAGLLSSADPAIAASSRPVPDAAAASPG